MQDSSQELAHASSIAEQIADYRLGEIQTPDLGHVIRWAEQLDPSLRAAALAELDHVLGSTYFSAERVTKFLKGLALHEEFTGGNPKAFWTNARLLDIQLRGRSQRDLNRLLIAAVAAECGAPAIAGEIGDGPFVYLDDALFTGNHVRRDIEAWVKRSAPQTADVHVVVLAHHEGSYYHRGELEKAIAASGKAIRLIWWRSMLLEDRKTYVNQTDVLRPRSTPDCQDVQAYVASLAYPVEYRTQGGIGSAGIFSSEDGRHALEQALLIAGVEVRKRCPALPQQQRPLGYHSLEMLGFGSMVATYRNCPNNAPIALWASPPWYPLLPRKVN